MIVLSNLILMPSPILAKYVIFIKLKERISFLFKWEKEWIERGREKEKEERVDSAELIWLVDQSCWPANPKPWLATSPAKQGTKSKLAGRPSFSHHPHSWKPTRMPAIELQKPWFNPLRSLTSGHPTIKFWYQIKACEPANVSPWSSPPKDIINTIKRGHETLGFAAASYHHFHWTWVTPSIGICSRLAIWIRWRKMQEMVKKMEKWTEECEKFQKKKKGEKFVFLI